MKKTINGFALIIQLNGEIPVCINAVQTHFAENRDDLIAVAEKFIRKSHDAKTVLKDWKRWKRTELLEAWNKLTEEERQNWMEDWKDKADHAVECMKRAFVKTNEWIPMKEHVNDEALCYKIVKTKLKLH